MSEATWQLVQDEVQVEPHGAIAVEDESTPVPVYAFCRMMRRRSGVPGRGMRARQSLRRPRAGDGASCRQRLAQVQDGRRAGGRHRGGARHREVTRARGIRPQPGRHARDVLRRALSLVRQHHALSARARPAAAALWDHSTRTRPRSITAKVAPAAAGGGTRPGREAAPMLLHLLGDPGGDRARHDAAARRSTRRGRLPSCGSSACSAVSEQPLILAVENLHWIDATSEDYLTSLVERLAGAPHPPAGDLPAGVSVALVGEILCDAAGAAGADGPRQPGRWCSPCCRRCRSQMRCGGRSSRKRRAIPSFWRS